MMNGIKRSLNQLSINLFDNNSNILKVMKNKTNNINNETDLKSLEPPWVFMVA